MEVHLLRTGTLTIALALASCMKPSATDDGASNLGATGTAGAGGATVDGGAGGEAGKGPLDCSAVHGGPAMVEVAGPGGTKYCIDSTEVTQAQYAKFLDATTQKPGTESAACGSNGSYEPRFSDDTSPGGACRIGPGVGPEKWYSPSTTPNRPMMCVDWCDALAFCQWAGKRLCGKVGGGSVSPSDESQYNSAAVSEYFYACTQGGTSTYPYGDAYDAANCPVPAKDAGVLPDVGAATTCHGSAPPYSNIYDMGMADVVEWEDACSVGDNDGILRCGVRGGGATLEQAYACAAFGTQPAMAYGPGFRCCKD